MFYIYVYGEVIVLGIAVVIIFCSSIVEVEVSDECPPIITFLMAATKSSQDSQSTVIEMIGHKTLKTSKHM